MTHLKAWCLRGSSLFFLVDENYKVADWAVYSLNRWKITLQNGAVLLVDFGELKSGNFFIGTDGNVIDSRQLVVGVVRERSELRLNEVRISSLFERGQGDLLTVFVIGFSIGVFLFGIGLVSDSWDKKVRYFACMGFDYTCWEKSIQTFRIVWFRGTWVCRWCKRSHWAFWAVRSSWTFRD